MNMDIVSAVKRGFLKIAHRGARSLAPENTLSAARKAFALGADMWEIDVRLSRDGYPVVVHDATLERTSDAPVKFAERMPWYVHDFTLDELRALDFGSWFNTFDPFGQVAAGEVTASEITQYRGERILTLEDALLFTVGNDWLINVEIKDISGLPGNEDIVKKVVELVVSSRAGEKTIISSFNHDYLVQAKKVDRKIRTGVLVDRLHRDPVELMLSLNAFSFHPGLAAVRPKQFLQLRKKGFGILVWVVNYNILAEILIRSGADGIFTDFPQKFPTPDNDAKRLDA
jgi:glycerophosphoryl diester phosphodiesterase